MTEQTKSISADVREKLIAGVRVLELRNLVYLPFFKGNDYVEAEAVLTELLVSAPHNIMLLRDAASLYIRLGNNVKAVGAIRQALATIPDPDTALVAQAIRTFLASNLVSDAAEIAAKHEALWEESNRLCHMALLALYRADDSRSDAAMRAAKTLIKVAPKDLELVAVAVNVLLGKGEAQFSLNALNSAGATASNHPHAIFEQAKAMHMLEPNAEQINVLLNEVLRLDPNHFRSMDLLAKRHLAGGEADLALALLKKIPAKKRTASINMHLATALAESGQMGEASVMFRKLVDADPTNVPLRRKLTGALAKAGDLDAARQIYAKGTALRGSTLDANFGANVRRIETAAPDGSIPQHRLDWAYSVLEQNNAAPADRTEWEVALHRHKAIDELLVNWIECRSDDFDAIKPFLHVDASERQAVDDILAQGRGMFVASAHVGLLFAGPITLQSLGCPLAWLASVPDLDRGAVDRDLISTTTNDEQLLARSIIRSLNEGKVVTIAIDGAAAKQHSKFQLFGNQVGLSEFVPRLAYRKGTPTVFPTLEWRDGKVHASLSRLPDPNPGEDVDVFTKRWMQDFIQNLEQVFLKTPDNLRMSGGFWTNLAR